MVSLTTRFQQLATIGCLLLLVVRAATYQAGFVLRRSFLRQTGAAALLTLSVAPEAPSDIASPESVVALLRQRPDTIMLDARRDDEIVQNGFVQIPGRAWTHSSCTLEEGCPLLQLTASSAIPDKRTPVVAYCSSGKRAAKAAAQLKSLGYQTVLNAGAFSNLGYLEGIKL